MIFVDVISFVSLIKTTIRQFGLEATLIIGCLPSRTPSYSSKLWGAIFFGCERGPETDQELLECPAGKLEAFILAEVFLEAKSTFVSM